MFFKKTMNYVEVCYVLVLSQRGLVGGLGEHGTDGWGGRVCCVDELRNARSF